MRSTKHLWCWFCCAFLLVRLRWVVGDGNESALNNVQEDELDICICDDDCDEGKYASCGYTWVKNGGGFVTKFCVRGKLESKERFCCAAHSYTEGFNEAIALPCGSYDLELRSEVAGVLVWYEVATEKFDSPNVTACYKISGTAGSENWAPYDCP